MELNKPVRDFAFYLAGSLIVAGVAIIKLPVFTSYFTPTEFGLFSLVSITYTYLSLALYNWITSCIYRFFNEYSDEYEKRVLYSNLVFLMLVSSLILFFISAGWFLLAADPRVSRLVMLAFFFLFTQQLFSMFLVVFKVEGRALGYNVYQAVQAVFSFLVILGMIRYNIRIEALFAGPVMINLVLLLMLCWKRRSLLRQLSVRFISPALIRRFTQYGFVGFLSSLGVFILVSSDRYIIALFEDISRVGIYNQVYQVGQVSVYFLITAYFNAITPGLNRLLTGKSTGAETRLEAYIQAFLLFMMPVTFYLSLFSEQVADFLLGGEFRQGYTMIPWIMVSSFFYGLSLFSETRMKFENRFKPVIQGVILACILNGVLNFALIPVLGYTWAAVTTFLAYFFLFLFYYKKDDIRYLRGETLRITGRVLMVLLLQYLADQILRKVLGIGLNKWLTLIEVIIFSVIYLAAVFRLGLAGSLRLTGLKP